jgi:large subunit ribosomal protein L1
MLIPDLDAHAAGGTRERLLSRLDRRGVEVRHLLLGRTIREVRGGRVEFRNDKTGLLHVAVGKVSFTEAQIRDNIASLMEAVKAVRPSAAKGVYVRSVTFTSTMGPGIRVDPSAAQAMQVSA